MRYVLCVCIYNVLAQESPSGKGEEEELTEADGFEHIVITQDAGLKTITLNRPTKYNALNHKVNIC